MARIDDYNQAFELGKDKLRDKDIRLVAEYSGVDAAQKEGAAPCLAFHYLNRAVSVSWPDLHGVFTDNNEKLSIQQHVLLVHYFAGAFEAGGAPLKGKWIAYQEVPDGRFYLDAFQKRAKIPLIQGFGGHPERLKEFSEKLYDARPLDHGDVSVVIQVLPLVPVALILWKGDDEFPPDGNILFDANITKILSAEDIAWLAGMVVYPLVGMSRARQV